LALKRQLQASSSNNQEDNAEDEDADDIADENDENIKSPNGIYIYLVCK
jgi:hypothetical protein